MELHAEHEKTALLVTEQGAFLDSYDDADSREQSTAQLLNALAASLKGVSWDAGNAWVQRALPAFITHLKAPMQRR